MYSASSVLRSAVLAATTGTLLLGAFACAPGSTQSAPAESSPTAADSAGASEPTCPEQEVSVIVGYPAGSAPDNTVRTLAPLVEAEIGQGIVILNQEGGNGAVGLTQLTSAQPDGATIGFTASPPLVTSWQITETGFAGPEAIAPVAITNEVPSVLFVNADSGIETIEDFVAAAQEASGGLTVGVPGAASIQRFQLEQFLEAASIQVEQVVTDAGQQILPVVNGTFQAGIAQPSPLLQYVETGDIRIIGYFGEQVPAGLDVPPFSEAGYDVTYTGFEGFVAPQGTPAELVECFAGAIETAVDSQEFQDFTAQTFGVPAFAGPEEMAERLQADVELNRELIERLGL